jgi:hypothetical protein
METSMNVGPYNFEPVSYYPEIDHLRAGGGQIGDATDPRHIFFYAQEDSDEPQGIELFGPREQLETEGAITVALPSGQSVRIPEAERLIRESPAADAA